MKLKTNDKKAEPTQVESRYAKVQELRKYHQATLDAYGRPDADFIPKEETNGTLESLFE